MFCENVTPGASAGAPSMVWVPRRPRSACETAVIARGVSCTSRPPALAAVTIVSAMRATRSVKDTGLRSPARARTARRCRLEPAPFCGNLVVAFWEVWKSEVARGVRVRCSDRDTPNRHMNACQRGLGLIDDGADDCGRRLRRWGTGHQREQQGRGEQ